jgi:hypothetical protein
MNQLNLPAYAFRLRNSNGCDEIFDAFRKKFVALTPEEWVRQNFIRYLVEEKKFPASLIIPEHAIKVNKMNKRCDVVVHDTSGKPLLIVECKAHTVKISQDVFDQVARYNIKLKVPYLIVTNGMEHYCCHIDHVEKKYSFIEDIPMYGEL